MINRLKHKEADTRSYLQVDLDVTSCRTAVIPWVGLLGGGQALALEKEGSFLPGQQHQHLLMGLLGENELQESNRRQRRGLEGAEASAPTHRHLLSNLGRPKRRRYGCSPAVPQGENQASLFWGLVMLLVPQPSLQLGAAPITKGAAQCMASTRA